MRDAINDRAAPTQQAVPADLLAIAESVLPDADLSRARLAQGQFHDVVLLPEVAAVRIARQPATAVELPRRTALLRRLAEIGLPFAVPAPLTDPVAVGDRMAVATTWLPGRRLPERRWQPETMAALLAVLRAVPLESVADLLDRPHAYAGRDDWESVLLEQAIPRLPQRQREEAVRRVQEASALPPEPPSLVHGDLGGHNVHFDANDNLVGVLDWDLAQPFDPAVDAACLAQHSWEKLRYAVDSRVLHRARVWSRTFGIEQIAAAILLEESQDTIDLCVARTVTWLDRQ